MTDTCDNCRFGHTMPYLNEDGSEGINTFCREMPPEFVPPNGSVLKPVRPDGWCGHHKPRPVPKRTKKAKVSTGLMGHDVVG